MTTRKLAAPAAWDATETPSRLISKKEAADYCGISCTTYDRWAEKRLVPGFLPEIRKIDRFALEKAVDKLARTRRRSTPASGLDAWRTSKLEVRA